VARRRISGQLLAADEVVDEHCRGLVHRQVARHRLRCWPRQDDRFAQSKLISWVSRWQRWIRAWGRDEPVTNDPDARPGDRPVKGGLDFPAVHDGCSHLARSRGCRLVAGSTTSRTGRVGIAVFASHNSLLVKYAPPVVHQPIEQGPGHGAVRVEGDPPSPEAGMCAQHKRPGFLTACDHAEQPRGLAC
jgi:hypothetical protein